MYFNVYVCECICIQDTKESVWIGRITDSLLLGKTSFATFRTQKREKTVRKVLKIYQNYKKLHNPSKAKKHKELNRELENLVKLNKQHQTKQKIQEHNGTHGDCTLCSLDHRGVHVFINT